MRRSALEDSIPDLPRTMPRMSFPAIQFAGWLAWLAGMACVTAGAAVAFVVMPAALEGHNDASLMGGTLFLGGCVAALGANNALTALQRRPEVVTRWLSSAFFGLSVASCTAAVAGVRGGADYVTGLADATGSAVWLPTLSVLPFSIALAVVLIALFRGGVLKKVEPVKVNTGSPRAAMWRWVRRLGGVAVLLVSGWCWWSFQAPALPAEAAAVEARGKSLQQWFDAWRKNGDVRGVEGFVAAGDTGRAAAIALAGQLITPRAQSRAERLRALGGLSGAAPGSFPPLRNLVLEQDVSEPVVKVLDRFCAKHDDAAQALKEVVSAHTSPVIQVRALTALVEGKRVEGEEGAAWIRELLEREPDPALRTLLELRLSELGG